MTKEVNEIIHYRSLENLREMRYEVKAKLYEVFEEADMDMTCAELPNFDDSEFTR